MRKIIYAEAMDEFELILIFDNEEFRILNIREFFRNDQGLLAEVRDDMFQSVEIDSDSGDIRWSNGGDIDSGLLYDASRPLKVL